MTTQITEQQYDVAALSLAVKVREFVYKHGTRFSHGAVDALACIFDSGTQARDYYRTALDALPVHVAAAFRGGFYMPVLSVTDSNYPTTPQREADAVALAAEALAFCETVGHHSRNAEPFLAYLLEGVDSGGTLSPPNQEILSAAISLRTQVQARYATT